MHSETDMETLSWIFSLAGALLLMGIVAFSARTVARRNRAHLHRQQQAWTRHSAWLEGSAGALPGKSAPALAHVPRLGGHRSRWFAH